VSALKKVNITVILLYWYWWYS